MSTTTPGNGTVQSFAYGYDNNGNIHLHLRFRHSGQ